MTETAIAGLDHSIVGVRDLEQARKTYEDLGFTVSRRGRHVHWGTANYCIMFKPDYIELLGIVDPEQYTAGLETMLEKREGAMKLIVRSDDAEATYDGLSRKGFHPETPRDLGRLLEMPDGEVELKFKLVHLPDAETPGLSTFMCQHLTPELVWRPEWTEHPNTAKAVYAYTILHEAPSELAATYRSLFGQEPAWQENRLIVDMNGGKLVFCTPDHLKSLHPGLVWNGPTDNGTIVAASIAVEDTDQAALTLQDNRIDYTRRKDGSVLVQAELAHGLALSFQAVNSKASV